ncbi:MAG: twin-arginine translocase TatA/TatE family subunit [Nitrososphaerales archaeon]
MLSLYFIGGIEWFWILLALLILIFGSKKLPELARSLGRAFAEFQKGKIEFERELRAIQEEITLPVREVKSTMEEMRSDLKTMTAPIDLSISKASNVSSQESKPSTGVLKELDNSQKILQIAKTLNINTEGKTNQQLKEEVKKKLEELG